MTHWSTTTQDALSVGAPAATVDDYSIYQKNSKTKTEYVASPAGLVGLPRRWPSLRSRRCSSAEKAGHPRVVPLMDVFVGGSLETCGVCLFASKNIKVLNFVKRYNNDNNNEAVLTWNHSSRFVALVKY
ncbi:ABC transporter [Striga asiatica]|uniref:ABC transporter n=1 Tax=Striga asiatica TaxID=4170 RepID=A0A5A7Q383_STRAF|nr:ABC transporter [Striga asiatica]